MHTGTVINPQEPTLPLRCLPQTSRAWAEVLNERIKTEPSLQDAFRGRASTYNTGYGVWTVNPPLSIVSPGLQTLNALLALAGQPPLEASYDQNLNPIFRVKD
jgi:hypothetical protein